MSVVSKQRSSYALIQTAIEAAQAGGELQLSRA